MDNKNIQLLMDSLVRLGFSAAIEHQLLYHVCLREKEFVIRERREFELDIVSYSIVIKINESGVKWNCAYFDAILRKEIGIEPLLLNGIDATKVEEQMRRINWQELANTGLAPVIRMDDKWGWEVPVLADEVMGDLDALSVTAEGRNAADLLRYKYWSDTPLERLIPNLPALKTRLELSQRFYILGKDSITADEAFRFLSNRWIQRQMQTDRKRGSGTGASSKHVKKSGTGGGRKSGGKKGNGS